MAVEERIKAERGWTVLGRLLDSKSQTVLGAVCFYWFVSISLVFLNKLAVSGSLGIDAPLFLTWTQVVIAVLSCLIFAYLKNLSSFRASLSFFPHLSFKKEKAVKILPLTTIFVAMIVFNNLCLKYVEVSFYNVARALSVVFNIILQKLLLNQGTSSKCILSVFVVVVGYYLGCEGEVRFSWLGITYGAIASLFVALYSNFVKKTLPVVDNDSWSLLYYNNVLAMIIMPLVFLLAGEYSQIILSPLESLHFWGLLVFTGLFGFLINIAAFLQIQVTSPVTHNVSGIAKSAAQTVLAIVIFRNPVTFIGNFGLGLVFAGSFAYGYFKNLEGKSKAGQDAVAEELEKDIESQDKEA